MTLYFSKSVSWVRLGHQDGPGLALHTPADKPLFSERNGYRRPLLKFRGWRLFTLPSYK